MSVAKVVSINAKLCSKFLILFFSINPLILRLLLQLQEAKNIARSRDQRVVELQLEADQLREQAARQNSIVSSLRKRIQVVPFPTIYIHENFIRF